MTHAQGQGIYEYILCQKKGRVSREVPRVLGVAIIGYVYEGRFRVSGCEKSRLCRLGGCAESVRGSSESEQMQSRGDAESEEVLSRGKC